MSISSWSKKVLVFHMLILMCYVGFANENFFRQARALQREGKYDEAVEAFKNYLSQPVSEDVLTDQQLIMYSEALVQLMNTFQSKGEPETCIATLQEVFKVSPNVQRYCLRDYYSILGYALSRTEKIPRRCNKACTFSPASVWTVFFNPLRVKETFIFILPSPR